MDMWIFLHSKSCMLSYIIRAILLSVISLAMWFFIIDFLFMWTVVKSIHIFNSVLCSPFHFSLLTFYTSFHLICSSLEELEEVFLLIYNSISPVIFSPLPVQINPRTLYFFLPPLFYVSGLYPFCLCLCIWRGGLISLKEFKKNSK